MKERSPQQAAEALSKGKLLTLLSQQFIVNPLTNEDFGFDFDVRITTKQTDANAIVSEQSFYVQNKSVIDSDGTSVYEDLSISDLELYRKQHIPLVLTKYDIKNDVFYWEIIQPYIADVIEKEDPNWRNQKTKRIHFTKVFSQDFTSFTKEILAAQVRIIRSGYLGLGLLEGIAINKDDLSDLKRNRERNLVNFKAESLLLFQLESKKGKKEAAYEALVSAYNAPGEDEGKVRAIIGIISSLNISVPGDNAHACQLADEGISLARKMGLLLLENYIVILKSEAELYSLNEKIGQLLISQKIANATGETFFSTLLTDEQQKLWSLHNTMIEKIDGSLRAILRAKNIYYYQAALLRVLDAIAHQTVKFSVFDRTILITEDQRLPLIHQCEFILQNSDDVDMKKLYCRSLANYYYLTAKPDKALEYIDKAITLAKEDNDDRMLEALINTRKRILNKPDIYAVPKQKPIDEMSLREYQTATKQIIEALGMEVEKDDSLKIAIRDINSEECFRHCEYVRIAYSTSLVGRLIALPSLGSKILWCKYGGAIEGFDLLDSFKLFKATKCAGALLKPAVPP
ncbi:MAG: DUF4365 domain-containing protein [Candidatus Micrarchaeota archaeon]|nr:DUF4365 domain-containing protein [Candidatus Micrarchaeota archaeon]